MHVSYLHLLLPDRVDDLQISHISDDRIPVLSGSAGEYKVGSKHHARVIGHSPLDGVLLLSFEKKVLDQVFMQVGELQVGQILKVRIFIDWETILI